MILTAGSFILEFPKPVITVTVQELTLSVHSQGMESDEPQETKPLKRTLSDGNHSEMHRVRPRTVRINFKQGPCFLLCTQNVMGLSYMSRILVICLVSALPPPYYHCVALFSLNQQ